MESFTPDTISNITNCLSSYDQLYAHNGIDYDFPLLRKVFGWEYTGRVVDTLLVSRLQSPNRVLPPECPDRSIGPHSVEAWGYRLGQSKQEHEDWSKFSEDMLRRCIQDVHIQSLIRKELDREAEGAPEGMSWRNARAITCKLFQILKKQEEDGWYVDRDHIDWCLGYLHRYISRIDKVVVPRLPKTYEIEEQKNALVDKPIEGEYKHVKKVFKLNGEYTKHVVNWRDMALGNDSRVSIDGPFSRVKFRSLDLDKPQEIKDYLLSLGWEPKEWNYDKTTGERRSPKLSKDEEFLGVESKLGAVVAKRTQAKQRRGIVQGWKDVIRGDGTISGRVNGLANTARAKHSVIVNVPGSDSFFGKNMRKIFRARPGWVMVGVDSAGNQMRQLAARMDDKEFKEAVLHGSKEKGTDLHSLNQERAGLPNRTIAKNFFYGCVLFGAGLSKTAKIVGCTKEEAKRYQEQYWKEMPKLASLKERLVRHWRASATKGKGKWGKLEYKNGWIQGLDGRPILVKNEHELLAYQLQSDEAIQMQAAYIYTHDTLIEKGYEWGADWRFLIWMHDEYQLECRPEIAEKVKAVAEEGITWAGRVFKINCPHEGEGVIGMNWSMTH